MINKVSAFSFVLPFPSFFLSLSLSFLDKIRRKRKCHVFYVPSDDDDNDNDGDDTTMV